MKLQDLKKWFDWAGLDLSIMPRGIPLRRDTTRPQFFAMDISRKGHHHDEFFRICPGDENVDAHVIDVDSKRHQVVMFVQEPPRPFTETVWNQRKGRYVKFTRWSPGFVRTMLVGKDQTHLFIAELPRGRRPPNTVEEAHRALKPPVVIARSTRTSRIKRQGEWFFVPATPKEEEVIELDKSRIVRYGAIGRRAGPHAHKAEEYLETERGVFVRGSIRHPDHHPLELNGWFRVVGNTEIRSSWAGSGGIKWVD